MIPSMFLRPNGRGPAMEPTSDELDGGVSPDPQVVPKSRRRHTSAYKLDIIAQADACRDRGDLGALLRREGLYHSDLNNFRKQKAQGALDGRRRSGKSDPALQEAVSQQLALERENRALKRQLSRAQQIIEIQKKAALLLGETLQEMSLDEPESENP